jgi:hypothetical protein
VQCWLTAGHRQTFSSRATRRHRCRTATASSKPYVGSLAANELKFAIVIARFNDLVTKLLLEGALEAFDRHGGDRDSVDVSAQLHKAFVKRWLAMTAKNMMCIKRLTVLLECCEVGGLGARQL